MPRIVYYVAASVDGFIATSDSAVEWLSPWESSDEDYGYAEFYRSVDAVVLGSRTYEQALTFGEWPYPGKPVRVASSRPLTAAAPNVVITSTDPVGIASELDGIGVTRAWLVGGGALAGSFCSAGLIGEYVISTMPVLLGRGVPLLGGHEASASLTLASVTRYPDGVIQSVYRPGP